VNERTAFIARRGLVPTRETVEAYLPKRYAVAAETRKLVVIRGTDYAGWTLEEYVIPRLWSGLITAREMGTGPGQGNGNWHQAATWQKDGQQLAAWISDAPALRDFIICDDGPDNPKGQYYIGTPAHRFPARRAAEPGHHIPGVGAAGARRPQPGQRPRARVCSLASSSARGHFSWKQVPDRAGLPGGTSRRC
jgi:hypothetical protein